MFRLYLDQFIIVFIDDILFYSPNCETHAIHIGLVLQTLRTHCLFIKLSKCELWIRKVTFLGHMISIQGMAADPSKIEVVISWLRPSLMSEMRDFLGLTGYYNRFV